MNKIARRILIGALAVSVPVAGSIFYFTTRDSNKDKAKDEIVDKDNKSSIDDKKDGDKSKNDDVNHNRTDAKVYNPHKEKITILREENDNSEIVGVLSIPGTSIDTPIVKHTDNEYYLDHDVKNEENVGGALYLDYRVDINSGRKNIIYGHNGDEELDLPFSELENYYDVDFYNEHPYVLLEDVDGVGTYQIFSVFVETHETNYMYLNFKNDASWHEHLNYLKNKSLYDTNVDVDSTDDILILQTCSHNEEYLKYKDRYLLVVAKRVSYE